MLPATRSRSCSAYRSRSSCTIRRRMLRSAPVCPSEPAVRVNPNPSLYERLEGGYDRPRAQSGPLAAARKPSVNPWLIAVLVAFASFMEVLDTTIANVLLQYIAGGLGVSQDEASWVVTTYLVANAVALTASSFLARLLGRKTFFLICLALFTSARCCVPMPGTSTRCCFSASCKALAVAAWSRWRSRSWRIPSHRRSAARALHCSAWRWWWRR